MAKRKLCHYFGAHHITIVNDKPLAELFSNREASSRISKWVVELSSHNISFQRRSAIKSQVLADFITDWTTPDTEPKIPEKQWVVFCDGAYNNDGTGIAAVVISPSGLRTRFAARLAFPKQEFRATNNVSEYEALLLALRKMKALG